MFSCNLLSLLVFIWIIYSIAGAQEKPRHDKKVVCYIATWATFRKQFPFTPSDIDPSLCTHLVYNYASLKKDTQDAIISYSPYTDLKEDSGLDYYGKITSLKKKYPHLKVLLCIGGWTEGSINYSKLARSAEKREAFVTNVINHLRKYNFDGLDIFWQYPAQRGGIPEDYENYVKLLRDLKEGFVKENFLLTVLLSVSRDTISLSYDLPEIGQIVDWINLYCHSFNSPWDKKFGINSPLDSNNDNNVKSIVNYYFDNGVPSNKLVLILPAAGFGFTNTDKPGQAEAMIGLYTEDKGYLTFHEICKFITDPKSGWKETWDNTSSTPVAVKGTNKISYENPKSLKLKVKFADEKDLAGMGIWTMDADDFNGFCSLPGYGNKESQSKFPLIKAINQEYESLSNGVPSPPPTLHPHNNDWNITVAIFEY